MGIERENRKIVSKAKVSATAPVCPIYTDTMSKPEKHSPSRR